MGSQKKRGTAAEAVRLLLSWYAAGGRRLPWRSTRNSYRILVSEVMLQQTQVGRVVPAYYRFLRRFPSFTSLARARQRSVVVAWRGMGYNNRAVRLHRLAKLVVRDHAGRLPADPGALLRLPGIGAYTADALLSFAFRRPVPVVDVNVRRVLSRIFWRMPTTADVRSEQEVRRLAGTVLPVRRAYEWNQALMDLGATVCRARRPLCASCPVASVCRSRTFMKDPVRTLRASEPTRYGVPDRIHRGRIVETLRDTAAAVTLDGLGGTILPQYAARDRQWLLGLLGRLEEDGLVRITRAGSPGAAMVRLA